MSPSGSGLGVSEDNGISQPEIGTLEALLTRLPDSALFIQTHRGQGLPASETAALSTRSGSRKKLDLQSLDAWKLARL